MTLNLEKIDLAQVIPKLKNIKGNGRGNDVKYILKHIRNTEGEEGVEKLKQELEKHGYRLPDEKELGDLQDVPLGMWDICMVVAAKLFGWTEKDVLEMGRDSFSHNLSLKLFIKFFPSPKTTLELAAKNWKKHLSEGEAEITEFDKQKKQIILRVKNFQTHPIRCVYQKGLFQALAEYVVNSKKVNIKETKCTFKGDSYHEYIINWE